MYKEIQEILSQIIVIFKKNEIDNWWPFLEQKSQVLIDETNEIDVLQVYFELESVIGGMGSLGDLTFEIDFELYVILLEKLHLVIRKYKNEFSKMHKSIFLLTRETEKEALDVLGKILSMYFYIANVKFWQPKRTIYDINIDYMRFLFILSGDLKSKYFEYIVQIIREGAFIILCEKFINVEYFQTSDLALNKNIKKLLTGQYQVQDKSQKEILLLMQDVLDHIDTNKTKLYKKIEEIYRQYIGEVLQ